MAFSISVEVRGVEQVIKWVDALPVRTRQQALVVFERWGRDMVRLGEDLSPRDKLRGIDPRRRKEQDSFALNWQYNVRPAGDGAELLVGNVAEHMRFVIEDTKPRAIPRSVSEQLAKGYPMRFFWRGGWYTAWKIFGGVAAHGTKGQPVHEKIVEEFNIGDHLSDISAAIK